MSENAVVKIANIDKKLYSKSKKDYSKYEDDIEDLAKNDDTPTSISQADISQAYSDTDQGEIDAARYLSQGIKMSPAQALADRENMLKFVGSAEADATKFSASPVEPIDATKIRSLAFKSMQNLSADPTDTTAPMGAVSGRYCHSAKQSYDWKKFF